MDATHLHCARCTSMQPIRFEVLVAGEPALGTSVYCARCRHHAFTLTRKSRFYCEICDDMQPAKLEPMELDAPGSFGVLLICGVCFDGKALLYARGERPKGNRHQNPDLSRY
jgi:hypothetical protein